MMDTGPRLYDTIEPAVIDEEMLKHAMEEQGPTGEAGKIAREEGIGFDDVTRLQLDFKNVLRIDNLWCFKNIVKLQLDNNIIEKIEGLETLTSLVWLDLSFNNIEMIEGLDTLTKLKDLTLYNNRIQAIENMDTLKDLEIFSIGNNFMEEISNIQYLRQFKQLKTLNLGGNPISQQPEYKSYVLAYLPHITYLDYRLVDAEAKKEAYDVYYIQVEELLLNERQAEAKVEQEESTRQEEQLHMDAFVERLNGPQLFDLLYADDVEGKKLNGMPGVAEALVGFREKFIAVCTEIFQYGLQEHSKRKDEIEMFWECVNEAKSENRRQGQKLIEDFQALKMKTFREVLEIQDADILEAKLVDYSNEIMKLWDALMGLEMGLVDQLEEVIKEFQLNLTEMVTAFTEHVQGFVVQLRDLENQHNERMMEIAIVTLEHALKNELDDDVSDELRELLIDKDTIQAAVTTSHDYHLAKIDNREDTLTDRITKWMNEQYETIHEEQEVKRNRNRVSEISTLIDHLRDEYDNLDIGVP